MPAHAGFRRPHRPADLQGVLVRSLAYYRPELGQSISTAQQDNVNRMADQIVSMMEVPW